MKRFSSVQISAITLVVFGIAIQLIYFFNTGNFNSPIVKFEFSENTEQIKTLFYEDNQLNSDIYTGIYQQNIADFAFMSAYTLFLILLFLRLIKYEKHKIYYLAVFLAALAFVFDIFENIRMFIIMNMMKTNINFTESLSSLIIITRIKWLSLSIVFLIISIHYYKFGTKAYILILFSTIPFVLGIISLIYRFKNYEMYYSYSVILAFLILIILSFFSVTLNKKISFYKKDV